MQGQRDHEGILRARHRRWGRWSAVLVLTAIAGVLLVPDATKVPARLALGCSGWIAAAIGSELLSAAGFVVVFVLVFGATAAGWRQSVPAGLRALGATTVLPGGGVVGPPLGAWSTRSEGRSATELSRATAAFVILTSVPQAVTVSVAGLLFGLGLTGGDSRHRALTLSLALIGSGLLAAFWVGLSLSARRRPQRQFQSSAQRAIAAPIRVLTGGAGDARSLIVRHDWKLAGALAYYAFDNTALWAAFHALGRSPAIGVVVMGYAIGSLAAALPIPAGLGVLDGGLIGALTLFGGRAAPVIAPVLLYRAISLTFPALLGAMAWVWRPWHKPARALSPPIRSSHQCSTTS
jgi:uncharacterized membrane protein YbhN (UPF0104 family)